MLSYCTKYYRKLVLHLDVIEIEWCKPRGFVDVLYQECGHFIRPPDHHGLFISYKRTVSTMYWWHKCIKYH